MNNHDANQESINWFNKWQNSGKVRTHTCDIHKDTNLVAVEIGEKAFLLCPEEECIFTEKIPKILHLIEEESEVVGIPL